MTLMLQAAAIDDRTIGQVFSISSESQRHGLPRDRARTLRGFLSLVLRHFGPSPEAVRAALDLVLRRKAITTEALSAQRDAVLGGKYPSLETPLRRLADLRMQIARDPGRPGIGGLEYAPAPTGAVAPPKRTAGSRIGPPDPRDEPGAETPQGDRRAVALALPEGVSLVEFVRFHVFDFQAVPARGEQQWQPARYLAFVFMPGQPDDVQMIDLGEAEPIDRLIADFRGGITGEAETRAGRNMVHDRTTPSRRASPAANVGPALRAAVFDPLVPALGGRTRLLLAPDGDLTRLPFEVLPDADGRLLIDDYRISYVGCGRDVLRFGAATTGPPAEPLVVADPDFDLAAEDAAPSAAERRRESPPSPATCDRDGDCHFDRLPGTRGRASGSPPCWASKPWLDAHALEGRLKRMPFAAHPAPGHPRLLPRRPAARPRRRAATSATSSGRGGRPAVRPAAGEPAAALGPGAGGGQHLAQGRQPARGGRGRPADRRGRHGPGPAGHRAGRAVGLRDRAGRSPRRRGRLRPAPGLRPGRGQDAGDEPVEGARRADAAS